MTKPQFDVHSGDAYIKNGLGQFSTTCGKHVSAAVERIDGSLIHTREFIFRLIDNPAEQPQEKEDAGRCNNEPECTDVHGESASAEPAEE